jgi:glycerate 2-kinase
MTLLEAAHSIFSHALAAADPRACVKRALTLEGGVIKLRGAKKTFPLSAYKNIFVLAVGKAGAVMARAAEELLQNCGLPWDGLVVVKDGYIGPLSRLTCLEAGHPLPDRRGEKAAMLVLERLSALTEHDLVISLISGGGSALLAAPAPGITLEQKIAVTRALLGCGAAIEEINTVRKHISRVKGGGLARAAAPAAVLNLLLSDVLYDREDTIASGPFSPDPTTFKDALGVLDRYDLRGKIPRAVATFLETGAGIKMDMAAALEPGQGITETPKPGDVIFNNVHTSIVGSNALLLEAAAEEARRLGFHTLLLSSCVRGEARELGNFLAAVAREINRKARPAASPACVLLGGETTVTVRGRGKGGRNQECALQAAAGAAGLEHTLIFCAGSDGTDGPTDAAGAWCDGHTRQRALGMGLDMDAYLNNNDSYGFFNRTGNLIKTGPTGTNLMDLYMLLTGPLPGA